MNRIVLSICIPVYNCGEFLPEALDSIIAQDDPRVEIIVYDGASTDNTASLMQGYLLRPRVKYLRGRVRGGIDADLVICVSHATGEFCWLFSGDDVMREGALAQALKWIQSGSDVVLCRHTICDIKMRYMFLHNVLIPAALTTKELRDPAQRHKWFAHAATTEAFFSFLSGIVVRKQTWDRGQNHSDFLGSCWAHVVRLLALADEGLCVTYVPEIWLDQRGQNDSFLHAGLVNRYRIAIEGYHKIAANLFGPASVEAFHIRRVLRNEFTLRMFLNAKVQCRENPEAESRALLDALYDRLHMDRTLESRCQLWIYRATPAWFAAMLRWSVRALRKISGKELT